MEQSSRHPVTIVFLTGHAYPPVVGFDFGDFAILLVYDWRRCSGFHVYYENEYKNYPSRLSYELRYFSKKYLSEFSFHLSAKTVQKIRDTFRNVATTPYETLFELLESCIPRDILPKFFTKT